MWLAAGFSFSMPARSARAWKIASWIVIGSLSTMGAAIGTAPAAAQAPRPGDAAPVAEAARALAAGDIERALLLARAYLTRHPNDLTTQLLLIRTHLAREDFESAYQMASRAARAHPGDADVLYYLGLITRRLAADEFERLGGMAPGSARVHQLQAEIYEAQQQRADAEKEYAAALAAQPDLLEALLGLGKLKRIRLACDEALPLYEKAEALRPTFDGAFGLGVCQGVMQKDELAVKSLERAVQRGPSEAVAWAALGSSLVKLGRTAEGIAKLQRAIAIAPDMDEAHYMLGTAYQASGDTARARDAFKEAERLRAGR